MGSDIPTPEDWWNNLGRNLNDDSYTNNVRESDAASNASSVDGTWTGEDGYFGYNWNQLFWASFFFLQLIIIILAVFEENPSGTFLLPNEYNDIFKYDIKQYYFDCLDKVREINGVKHINFPFPDGLGKYVFHPLPLFLIPNAFMINILYLLSDAGKWLPDGSDYSFTHGSMRVIEAAVSIFVLVDKIPIYSNAAELDALITLLALVSTPQGKICLCRFANQVLQHAKGPNYQMYLDNPDVTEYSHTAVHLAWKIIERLEIPYYNS